MRFSLSSWKKNLLRKSFLALALGTGGIGLPGCVMLPGMGHECKTSPNGATIAHAVAIHTYWDRDLQQAPDPTRGGQKGSCLVGRMILLGQDGKAVCSEGKLKITLYDEQPPQGGPPQAVEYWQIDAENMSKMVQKDALKLWGYTLILPTAMAPHLSEVRVELTFEQQDSPNPIQATSGAFWLNKPNKTSMSISSRTGQVIGQAQNSTPGQPTAQAPGVGGQPVYTTPGQPMPQGPDAGGQPPQQTRPSLQPMYVPNAGSR